jgi:hypothetical protein
MWTFFGGILHGHVLKGLSMSCISHKKSKNEVLFWRNLMKSFSYGPLNGQNMTLF